MFKNILVPLDGTTLEAKLLPHVTDLAKSQHADVTLLAVVNISDKVHLADAGTQILEAVTRALQRVTENSLRRTAWCLKARGINVNWVCSEGIPEQVITQYAADASCDLIAMVVHSHGRLGWIFGSVAEKVAMLSTVPVLLIRADED